MFIFSEIEDLRLRQASPQQKGSKLCRFSEFGDLFSKNGTMELNPFATAGTGIRLGNGTRDRPSIVLIWMTAFLGRSGTCFASRKVL
jgi:hypothetical protein